MKKTPTEATTTKTTAFASCCLCFRVTLEVARVEWHLLVFTLSIFCTLAQQCSAVGYSYTRFEGPVVGPERLVTVPDANGVGTHSDYVARPEYSFAYGIEDGKSRVLQNRKETRNGDEVRGVYSVVDPDGTLRVVKYTADDANGFQAEVITNGVARLHGHGSSDDSPANVAQQVEHDEANEVGHHADEEDQNEHSDAAVEEEEEEYDDHDDDDEQLSPKKAKSHYKVHEDHNNDDEDDGEGEDNEGGGDHEEYEGSSEEGYEDAKKHNQHYDHEESEEY